MQVLAGIVTYNPDVERLKENVLGLINQVSEILIVDNGSMNIMDIRTLSVEYNLNLIENKKNLGIATALNKILDHANNNHYDWFLTMDQDSVLLPGTIENYSKYIEKKDIAIISCLRKDRNSTINSKVYSEPYREVRDCITSGSLNNTKRIIECGRYLDELFIDLVDIEICHRIIKKGYKVIEINYLGLLHELGNATNVKFLKKTLTINNESAIRTYYIFRNLCILYKKNMEIYYLKYYFINFFKIMIYENNRLKKIKMIIRGTKDAKRDVMGRIQNE